MKDKASDIHLEPFEDELRIRYRIDGVLHVQTEADAKIAGAVALRLKLMSGLDISEKRLPQDGRIKLRVNMGGKQKTIDYRVSVLPCLFGEKIVLRLLDSDKLMLDLTKLGYPVGLGDGVVHLGIVTYDGDLAYAFAPLCVTLVTVHVPLAEVPCQ